MASEIENKNSFLSPGSITILQCQWSYIHFKGYFIWGSQGFNTKPTVVFHLYE